MVALTDELAALPTYLEESLMLVHNVDGLKIALAKSVGEKNEGLSASDLMAATTLKDNIGKRGGQIPNVQDSQHS